MSEHVMLCYVVLCESYVNWDNSNKKPGRKQKKQKGQARVAFVAVVTEFERTLLPTGLGRLQRHLLAIETGGAQQFPLVAPVRRHRAFDAHGAPSTAK